MSEFKERIIKLPQQRAEAESQRLLNARRVLTVAVELATLLSRNGFSKDIIFTERTLNEPLKRFKKSTYTDQDLVTGWLIQNVHKESYQDMQSYGGLILEDNGDLITYWALVNNTSNGGFIYDGVIDGGRRIHNRITNSRSEGNISLAGYDTVREETLRDPIAVENLLVEYVVDRGIDYSTL